MAPPRVPELIRKRKPRILAKYEDLYLNGELTEKEYARTHKDQGDPRARTLPPPTRRSPKNPDHKNKDARRVRSVTFDDKRVQAILDAGREADIINLNDADIETMKALSNDLTLRPRRSTKAKGLIIHIKIPHYCFKEQANLTDVHNTAQELLTRHVKKKGPAPSPSATATSKASTTTPSTWTKRQNHHEPANIRSFKTAHYPLHRQLPARTKKRRQRLET